MKRALVPVLVLASLAPMAAMAQDGPSFSLIAGRDVSALDRSIDLRVSRLRKRFEQGGHSGKFIKTVYGAGYLLAATVTWR